MDYFFFQNKSRPDYLVVAKGNASEQELDRFSAEVESKLRGTKKTGKFLVRTEGFAAASDDTIATAAARARVTSCWRRSRGPSPRR